MLINKNDPENTLVHVVFHDNFDEEYECVGVLIKEEKNSIRIAFSAKNDKVVDYMVIKRANIINIDVLDHSNIKNL